MRTTAQVLDLPLDSQGLAWIAGHTSSQLLLIPGVKPASIAAAAAGNQDALAYLRFAAQQFAALGSTQNITALDRLCLEASRIDDDQRLTRFLDQPKHAALQNVYRERLDATVLLLDEAVDRSQLDALKWLRALCHRSCSDTVGLMQMAAQQGNLSMLGFLHSGPHPAPWCTEVTHSAAAHIDCLLWLISQNCPCDNDIVAVVAETGNLDALMQLRAADNLPLEWWDAEVCANAAMSGNLAMLQYLRTLDPPVPWDGDVCSHAVNNEDISMLRWVRAQDPACAWEANCTAIAAAKGNLPMLEWLCSQDMPCPLDSMAVNMAAQHGQLAALQWLRSRQPPCPWTEQALDFAASQPDLAIVQWLRCQDPPAPWSEAVSDSAASRGDLAMLQWLHTQDPPCPLSSSVTRHAATRGHLPMLEWVSQQEQQADFWHGGLYCYAAAGGHVSVLKWLHAKGVPAPEFWSVSTSMAAFNTLGTAMIPILMFLGDIGVPMPLAQQGQLTQGRKTFCTFHGLLRWCQHAVSDPSRSIHLAFDDLLPTATGQRLLVHLSMLPPELLDRIAVAAHIQHDYI